MPRLERREERVRSPVGSGEVEEDGSGVSVRAAASSAGVRANRATAPARRGRLTDPRDEKEILDDGKPP